MKVYSYNWATGEYMGEEEADESPMEPGVWLLPSHTTVQPPPDLEPGQRAVWRDEAWNVEAMPVIKEQKPKPLTDDVFGGPTMGDLFNGNY